jgi:hypothetical protein
LTADYFDSVHPLPEVRIFVFTCCRILFASTCVFLCLCTLLTYLCAGSPIPCFAPSSSRGRAPSS